MDNDKCKILFKNVKMGISPEVMGLILENPRFVGGGEFEIVKLIESNERNQSERDIIVEYKSEESAEALMKIGKISYKNFELIPSLFTSNTPLQTDIVPATYEIRDTFKYPFYLLNLNKDLLENFEIELNKCDAKIKSIDEEKIEIEKVERITDKEVEKNWYSDLEDCLKRFKEKYVCQIEMNNIDENSWPQIRNKAIDICKNTDGLSLIYRNIPNNYLRIDGELKLIKKIVDEELLLI
ncbi:hypothetical protein BpHYR1_022394 [Brachionus plicatilis]|uniref:Uncharacterized protein n=1 Tax=Brachionus plicatilis TaxID=10195 RepID=A0A3M7RCK6_BRAPC|nr:hypothetical protein BpHYR1_022394 [Brachionus plicatilis]